MFGSKGGGGSVGDEVRGPRTSCHASIRTKVSGGFQDLALMTPPQQKFKLLVILLDSMVPEGLPELPISNSVPTHNFPNSNNIFLLSLKSDN